MTFFHWHICNIYISSHSQASPVSVSFQSSSSSSVIPTFFLLLLCAPFSGRVTKLISSCMILAFGICLCRTLKLFQHVGNYSVCWNIGSASQYTASLQRHSFIQHRLQKPQVRNKFRLSYTSMLSLWDESVINVLIIISWFVTW